MKSMQGKFPNAISRQVRKGLLAAAVLAGATGIAHRAALAQAVVNQQGMLAPMEDTYTFEGETGQTMTIELQSEDFDTILLLKGPDGKELISNDDYGGTFNSTIVLELPASGTYSAIASSFDGQGGSYQIEVRPASEFEVAFRRAYDLSISEDYEESVEAYTAAITIDDTEPSAYLSRAEARVNQAYITSTTGFESPQDLPSDVVEAVVADYLKAADLLEQRGQTDLADSFREQAELFTEDTLDGLSSPEEPATRENDPDDTDSIVPDSTSETEDAAIPVEPDGGIGDGAEGPSNATP